MQRTGGAPRSGRIVPLLPYTVRGPLAVAQSCSRPLDRKESNRRGHHGGTAGVQGSLRRGAESDHYLAWSPVLLTGKGIGTAKTQSMIPDPGGCISVGYTGF